MVSGNQPDFMSLNEAEKRAVAERLLRIKESGWRPFWCRDPKCSGDPHPKRTTSGKPAAATGAEDEETAEWYVVDGEDRFIRDAHNKKIEPHWKHVGTVALEPEWSHNHARRDQRLPAWKKPWTLFIMSGRGSGKTRTGTEFVTLCARRGLDGAIIGRRGNELVNTHVKTLMDNAHPDFRPEYQASKDLLVWPNGSITYLFSAERPENIRSVNLSYFWADEAAFMPEIETAWMNAKMATRIEKPGNPIHILITSTPTSTPWVMKMEDDPDVEVRRVSTYANRVNLSKDFLDALEKEYEGTRMGRQELHGEVLRDVEGALWTDDLFRHLRLDEQDFAALLDSMDDIVVAVDPAGSKGPRSDATGIIAVGVQHNDENGQPLQVSRYYVLADGTVKGSPTEWAERVYAVAGAVKANRIIAEKNFGGDMVQQVLTDWAAQNGSAATDHEGDDYRIVVEHASQSKETRAEGTVGKYEQGRVTHVTSPTRFGDLSELEKEQTMWVPKSRGGRLPSPNRVDALVWAVRALEGNVRHKAVMARSVDVMKQVAGMRRGRATSGGGFSLPRV